MWCEACQDHFDKDHYDAPYTWTDPDGVECEEMGHGVGAGYGRTGWGMAVIAAAERVVDAWEGDDGNLDAAMDTLREVLLYRDVSPRPFQRRRGAGT